MKAEYKGFGTKAIHAGNIENEAYGALSTPIYQSSTYYFDSCEQGGRRFAGEEGGYIYTRLGNPTASVLERKVAALENAEAAIATSSGMGAIPYILCSGHGTGQTDRMRSCQGAARSAHCFPEEDARREEDGPRRETSPHR